ncbi:transcription factor bHLH113-like isoform X2 [Macadamia integrifolia]|uniref:transcription factor bHLH113-like isoform X2 n=1 Tax=Macadamia integrifolia TaxID=60698 RepID=UPI001C500E07|nr:transcription factor bHLH113-like isoform X2 [Macadamia integrifolia]
MASVNEGFDEDLFPGGNFTDFLGSVDDASLDMAGTGSFIFPVENTPEILCFEKPCNQGDNALSEYGVVAQKSGTTASDSSSATSSNHSSTGSFSKSQGGEAKIEQKKRNELDLGSVPASGLVPGVPFGNQRTNKKAKTENPASTGPAKAKKERIGERIITLQKLVCPYGKTDAASVLHEAMGYIRFLHDQVQVLSSPYMQRLPSSEPVHEGRGKEEEGSKCDLRSRGLCLVPVQCMAHVANSNGADFWLSGMASNSNSKQ